jgi:hypothetical protein
VRTARVAIAILAVALSGCGLEILPVLDPPTCTEMTEVNASSELTNVPTGVFEFRGYELYYKFYTRDQEKPTGPKTIGELTAAGFLRICSDSGPVASQLPPVIFVDPVDHGDPIKTQVLFTPPEDPAIAKYQGATPRDVALRRSVESGGIPKTFSRTSFDQFDADVAAIWDEVQATLPDKELHLVLYVLSNGLIDYSPTLYSEARYVGTMIYRLP